MAARDSYGSSWADLWDSENIKDPINHHDQNNQGKGKSLTKKYSEKFGVGVSKTKEAASTGMDKTKTAATKGMKKVKDGASIGFDWIKDKCKK